MSDRFPKRTLAEHVDAVEPLLVGLARSAVAEKAMERLIRAGLLVRADDGSFELTPEGQAIAKAVMIAVKGHRVRWFAIFGDQRFPRNHMMSKRGWGWDVVCECGWESRTGGAIAARIEEARQEHLNVRAYCADHPDQAWAFEGE